jgi:ferredoxin
LARADAFMNRLYGWRGNPLYHTGVLAASLFAVVLVTGVYLLLFYRIGAPWDSVDRISRDLFLGSWTRSLHRYASDACVVAVLLHAFRMLVQRRSWGPRTLAWVSGVVLLGLVLICGWTGYVMVWDVQGQVLAQEGARWLDALPVFSEPISRAFDGSKPLPGAFFFLNLFAHVALPVGLGAVLWVHVARVARPVLLPPRRLGLTLLGALGLVSFLLPAALGPQADPFTTPGTAPYDVFFSFFLPLTRPLASGWVWLGICVICCLLLLVPRLTRPRSDLRPSVVDERLCTGCEQCWLDCPYEAIQMVPRSDGRAELVAWVNPDVCTSCGVCAGSCAPMGVGPAGRTGRDQLSAARAFVAGLGAERGEVVVIACDRSAGRAAGAPVFPVTCAGNLHSSTVEYLLRSGAGGVLVAACPPRDCWSREGVKWMEARLFRGREAELQDRVDRRRVRVVYAAEAEGDVVAAALATFRRDLAALAATPGEPDPDVARECETAGVPGGDGG